MFWLPSARGQHADKDAAQGSNRDCFPWAFVDKVVSGIGHHAIFCANHIPGFGERFFARGGCGFPRWRKCAGLAFGSRD
jgi:hypothetical protein